MLKNINNSIKLIDFRLFFALLIIGIVPTIYKTARIFYLGDLPIDWGFNIASQLAWVNVIYEVLQEAIMLPLFYLMGKSLSNKLELSNKVKTGLIITIGIYTFISIFIFLFIEPLTIFMVQKKELIDATVSYIRFETIASIFLTAVQFLLLVLITIKKETYLYIFLLLQMILSIFSDTILVSKLPISFDLGVNGIAIGNIVTNMILLVVMISFLKFEGLKIDFKDKLSFNWMREWLKVGSYSGLESLIRNAAFILMVLQMVNIVGEQGTFWIANSFIWGWLLLPVLQLGQLVKRDCGEYGNDAIKQRTLGYFAITGIIVLVWLVSLPFWILFIKNVMNVTNYQDVYQVALTSVIFYVLFAFNNVIDSIFYGIGKTNYMLFQSIIVNTIFYGTLFFLYLFGIYTPTLNLIVIMFGIGIAFDSLLTFAMFFWMLKRRKINLLF